MRDRQERSVHYDIDVVEVTVHRDPCTSNPGRLAEVVHVAIWMGEH